MSIVNSYRGGEFMIKKIAVGTGVFITSAALAASVAFAQTSTTTPTSTISPSPTSVMSPTTSPTLPSGAPATGRGL